LKEYGNEGDERSINLAEHSRNLVTFGVVDRTPDGTHHQKLSGPSPALEHAQAQLASESQEKEEVVLLGQDPTLASGVKLLEEVLGLGNVALSA
jgi:hypothetical protein